MTIQDIIAACQSSLTVDEEAQNTDIRRAMAQYFFEQTGIPEQTLLEMLPDNLTTLYSWPLVSEGAFALPESYSAEQELSTRLLRQMVLQDSYRKLLEPDMLPVAGNIDYEQRPHAFRFLEYLIKKIPSFQFNQGNAIADLFTKINSPEGHLDLNDYRDRMWLILNALRSNENYAAFNDPAYAFEISPCRQYRTMDYLLARNSDNNAKVNKLREFKNNYDIDGQREIRGDGDCYYRAIIIGMLEQIVSLPSADERCKWFNELAERFTLLNDFNSSLPEDLYMSLEQIQNNKELILQLKRAGRGECWTAPYELEHDLLKIDGDLDTHLLTAVRYLSAKEYLEGTSMAGNNILVFGNDLIFQDMREHILKLHSDARDFVIDANCVGKALGINTTVFTNIDTMYVIKHVESNLAATPEGLSDIHIMLDMTGAGHYNLYRTESVQRDYTRAQQAENSKDLLQIKVSPTVIRSCLCILTEYLTKLSPSDNLHGHIVALIEHTRRFNSAYNKPIAYPIYKNQCKIILDLKRKPEGWEKVSEVFRHMFNVFDRLWTGIVWLGTGTLLGKKTMAETYNPLAYAVTLGHRNHFFTEPVKNIRTKIELFDNAVTQLELYSRGLSSDHGSIVP